MGQGISFHSSQCLYSQCSQVSCSGPSQSGDVCALARTPHCSQRAAGAPEALRGSCAGLLQATPKDTWPACLPPACAQTVVGGGAHEEAMAAAEHASSTLGSGEVPHDTGMGQHVGECLHVLLASMGVGGLSLCAEAAPAKLEAQLPAPPQRCWASLPIGQ